MALQIIGDGDRFVKGSLKSWEADASRISFGIGTAALLNDIFGEAIVVNSTMIMRTPGVDGKILRTKGKFRTPAMLTYSDRAEYGGFHVLSDLKPCDDIFTLANQFYDSHIENNVHFFCIGRIELSDALTMTLNKSPDGQNLMANKDYVLIQPLEDILKEHPGASVMIVGLFPNPHHLRGYEEKMGHKGQAGHIHVAIYSEELSDYNLRNVYIDPNKILDVRHLIKAKVLNAFLAAFPF